MSRRAPAPPPKPSSSTVRTVVLVAVVAGIAALVLSRGFGGSSSKSSAGAGNGTTTKTTKAGKPGATTTAGETVPTTPAPTLPPIAPAALKVVVLNGNGIAGTAGKRKDELVKLGYTATLAKDALKKDFATTAVYYAAAEFKDAGNAVAAKMGLTASLAPTDTSYVDPANIAGMNVIVLLGTDKAQTPIAANPAAPATAAVATSTPPLTQAKATATTKKP
jgi:hypothetical protein